MCVCVCVCGMERNRNRNGNEGNGMKMDCGRVGFLNYLVDRDYRMNSVRRKSWHRIDLRKRHVWTATFETFKSSDAWYSSCSYRTHAM